MIEIESNVPLPRRRNGRPMRYPLADMKVGDSFKVDCAYGEEERTRCAVKGSFRRLSGMRFQTRAYEGVVRVWRVE